MNKNKLEILSSCKQPVETSNKRAAVRQKKLRDEVLQALVDENPERVLKGRHARSDDAVER